MRYFEIILKLAFLAGAIYLLVIKNATVACIAVFLMICLVLGVVLIFNKNASYHFKQAKKDLVTRRIEGVILIAFSLITYFVI